MTNALRWWIVERSRDRIAPRAAMAAPLEASRRDPLHACVAGAADRLFHAVQRALARGDADALARLAVPALASVLRGSGPIAGDPRRRRAEVSAVLALECLGFDAGRGVGEPSATVRIVATLRDPAAAGLAATWLVEERWRLRRREGEWVVAEISRCQLAARADASDDERRSVA